MDGIGWQEQNELFEFVNNLDMISEDSYTWVTRIDDDYSWVSDKTRVAFGGFVERLSGVITFLEE